MPIDSLRQDLRYSIRGLRAKPGFTIAVVTTLALGIGANATMFGIVDRLLFRPPDLMKDPAAVHRVYTYETDRGKEHASGVGRYVRFLDLTRWTHSFSSIAGFASRTLAVGIGDDAREMNIGAVSSAFFGFFDAPPVLGRYFVATEDQPPQGAAVAVLSYPMWLTRYGGRRDVLGGGIQIGSVKYAIIGVAPKGFVGLWPEQPPAAFIPIANFGGAQRDCRSPTRTWWQTYSCGWMNVIVHRKPGVSIAAANADLTQAFAKSYEEQRVEQPRTPAAALARPHAIAGSILAERGPNESPVAKVATWLGGVSVIVLLIACANVANLLLARALRRRREIALRLALGVSRARLVSQLLTESIVLAALGGAVGLLAAHWGGTALRAGLLNQSEAPAGLRDPRTVIFALVAAAAVGLLTGLAPVFQSRRADLVGDLKAGSREGTYTRSRLRVALLVFQGALSVVLLCGAGLFVRSLSNVENVRLGYDVDPVLYVSRNMRGVKLDSVLEIQLVDRLLESAKQIPGVASASRQTGVPFWSMSSTTLFVEGIDTVSRLGQFDYNVVTPDYFKTMGTRIVRGRGLANADTREAPRVMVVSQAMGRVLWPGRDAIGQCVRISTDTMPCTTVVGIAENIKEQSIRADAGFYYYTAAAQYPKVRWSGLFVRMRGNAAEFKESVRRALQHEMPGAAYVTVTPLSEIVGPQMRSWHLGATMFVAFGALALVLAAIGLYSVIAYNVSQRTHELGVRMALGAQASDLARLVVKQGLGVAAVGVGIGVVVALWASRWVEPLLFEVSPRDTTTYSLVAATLLLVAIAASWIPARRATRVNPNIALRAE